MQMHSHALTCTPAASRCKSHQLHLPKGALHLLCTASRTEPTCAQREGTKVTKAEHAHPTIQHHEHQAALFSPKALVSSLSDAPSARFQGRQVDPCPRTGRGDDSHYSIRSSVALHEICGTAQCFEVHKMCLYIFVRGGLSRHGESLTTVPMHAKESASGCRQIPCETWSDL